MYGEINRVKSSNQPTNQILKPTNLKFNEPTQKEPTTGQLAFVVSHCSQVSVTSHSHVLSLHISKTLRFQSLPVYPQFSIVNHGYGYVYVVPGIAIYYLYEPCGLVSMNLLSVGPQNVSKSC